jgi:hypothetical protein
MKKIYLAITFLFAWSAFSIAQSPYLKESTKLHPDKLAWWQDARFGLFVHWPMVKLRVHRALWGSFYTIQVPLSTTIQALHGKWGENPMPTLMFTMERG